MAWPEKRAHGWVVRWVGPDGHRHTSPAYPNRAACLAAIRAFEIAHPPRRGGRRAGPRPAEPLTIAQLAALWRESKLANEARMRRPGAAAYLENAKDIAIAAAGALGWERPGDATVAAVERWRVERAHRGVNRPAAYLRAILRWGRDRHGTACDPQVFAALRPPPSRRANVERMSDEHVEEVLRRAHEWGVWPLFSCLVTYGWRPITACRIRVGWLRGSEIQIDVKHGGEPHVHPLFPVHVEQLRALAGKRAADDALFLDPRSRAPWSVTKRGSANGLALFYRDHLRPKESVGCGNVYALKRVALSRMAAGERPWSGRLELADVRRFTGHRTDAIVMRYLTTSAERTRSLMSAINAPELPSGSLRIVSK